MEGEVDLRQIIKQPKRGDSPRIKSLLRITYLIIAIISALIIFLPALLSYAAGMILSAYEFERAGVEFRRIDRHGVVIDDVDLARTTPKDEFSLRRSRVELAWSLRELQLSQITVKDGVLAIGKTSTTEEEEEQPFTPFDAEQLAQFLSWLPESMYLFPLSISIENLRVEMPGVILPNLSLESTLKLNPLADADLSIVEKSQAEDTDTKDRWTQIGVEEFKNAFGIVEA